MKRRYHEVHVRSYIGEEEEDDVSGKAEITCEVSGGESLAWSLAQWARVRMGTRDIWNLCERFGGVAIY